MVLPSGSEGSRDRLQVLGLGEARKKICLNLAMLGEGVHSEGAGSHCYFSVFFKINQKKISPEQKYKMLHKLVASLVKQVFFILL